MQKLQRNKILVQKQFFHIGTQLIPDMHTQCRWQFYLGSVVHLEVPTLPYSTGLFAKGGLPIHKLIWVHILKLYSIINVANVHNYGCGTFKNTFLWIWLHVNDVVVKILGFWLSLQKLKVHTALTIEELMCLWNGNWQLQKGWKTRIYATQLLFWSCRLVSMNDNHTIWMQCQLCQVI